MTVKDTSLQAYWSERLSKRINKQQVTVLESLNIYGPGTRKQIAHSTGLAINCVCGRVKELLDMQAVEEFTKVIDADTRKPVWVLRIKENECHA